MSWLESIATRISVQRISYFSFSICWIFAIDLLRKYLIERYSPDSSSCRVQLCFLGAQGIIDFLLHRMKTRLHIGYGINWCLPIFPVSSHSFTSPSCALYSPSVSLFFFYTHPPCAAHFYQCVSSARVHCIVVSVSWIFVCCTPRLAICRTLSMLTASIFCRSFTFSWNSGLILPFFCYVMCL